VTSTQHGICVISCNSETSVDGKSYNPSTAPAIYRSYSLQRGAWNLQIADALHISKARSKILGNATGGQESNEGE
jgi:hypothetical protein